MLESLLSGIATDSAIERLSRWRARRINAYATAMAIVAIATLLRLLLDPFVHGVAPFLTYFVSVLVTALVGGFGPALLTIACFVVLGWFLFVPPYFTFALTKSDPAILVIFAVAATVMAVLMALVNSIVERLLQQRTELVTLREREAQTQQFIIRELQHRTANLLVHIKMMAAKSFYDPSRLKEDRDGFLERIDALAMSIRFGGDSETRTLSAMLRQVLKPNEDRIDIEGCDIELSDQVLQQWALIAHELQTNAMKYGGLSNNTGRVKVSGRIDSAAIPPTFHLLWQERDGPTVKPPHRRGFGQTTLMDAPQYQGATVSLNYDPQGVCYQYSIALSEIVPKPRGRQT